MAEADLCCDVQSGGSDAGALTPVSDTFVCISSSRKARLLMCFQLKPPLGTSRLCSNDEVALYCISATT